MTQEEKNLLLKDLCARLPYGVICNVKDDKINKVYTLNGVERGGCTFQSRMALYGWNSFAIKPYLRPMSSMTEEERKYLQKLPFPYDFVDWLNAHHFDFRNLIEKGLAIEVNEENNPYK